MSPCGAAFDRGEPLPEEQTGLTFSLHILITEQDLKGQMDTAGQRL